VCVCVCVCVCACDGESRACSCVRNVLGVLRTGWLLGACMCPRGQGLHHQLLPRAAHNAAWLQRALIGCLIALRCAPWRCCTAAMRERALCRCCGFALSIVLP
jgi:hypothetical protein